MGAQAASQGEHNKMQLPPTLLTRGCLPNYPGGFYCNEASNAGFDARALNVSPAQGNLASSLCFIFLFSVLVVLTPRICDPHTDHHSCLLGFLHAALV